MKNGAKAYLATQVTTTTQGDLLLMLYDAAIKFLKQAKVKIAERNYAEKGILISRALDIISELAESLNKEKGGDVAKNLNNLYFFCSTRLLKANLKMDAALIDEVVGILSGIRSAFAQIIPGYEGRPPSALHGASPLADESIATPKPAHPMPQVNNLDLMGSPAQPLAGILPQNDNAATALKPARQASPVPASPAASPTQQPGVNRLRAINAYASNRG
ncbi:MAG TPA: flagellar export chaperone FliS [Desulfovibrio sp.]|jgi:flagellar protein FliS|uniref:flagellar export chaperone FliS n=1 Tax=Desulfovibrio TaxID=872 RepID=UPI000418C300|nr:MULTISPECIES: flagellar export chaperone FliS [Desulfovibrio]MDY0305065.1 flagellar export chaperone FliS [Desulfovibrionaceae bacterium]HMM37798.1 flagellar export chaperone FliS [Desulfovibrio sp.]